MLCPKLPMLPLAPPTRGPCRPLQAVSYNVAKSVGVENDAVTTTVEGAFITTVGRGS